MNDKINNIKDLVEILEHAESNAKEVKEIKHLVGYDNDNFPGTSAGLSLAKYIENYTQSFEDKWRETEKKFRDITSDYVKSQCDKTHVMVPRDDLKQLMNNVEDALYEQTNATEEMQSGKGFLEEAEYHSESVEDSLRNIEHELGELASLNLPKMESLRKEDNQDNK